MANPSTSETSTHFAVLGLPVSFALDETQLHRAYIVAQQAAHPDREPDPAARLKAVQRSADVNIAYRILSDPLHRAEYLLALHGVRVNGEADTVKPGQALLLESLELRERLMEEAPQTLQNETAEGLAECERQFAERLAAEDFAQAAQVAMRWRFFSKFRDELRQRAAP